jgi:hypothetical protein
MVHGGLHAEEGPRAELWQKLQKKKKKRRWVSRRPPPLTVEQILEWADAYHARNGRWPNAQTRKITGAIGETWTGVDLALRRGNRGLEGGSSLARLLAQHRGVTYKMEHPRCQKSKSSPGPIPTTSKPGNGRT